MSHGGNQVPLLTASDSLANIQVNSGSLSRNALTGETLLSLQHLQKSRRHSAVRKALKFLYRQCAGLQHNEPTADKLLAICYALRGLAAMQADLAQPWAQQMIEWLLACQNDEGGWGEQTRAQNDDGCAAISDASLSANVLLMLLDVWGADHPAVVKGMAWLLEKQRDDGSWRQAAQPPQSLSLETHGTILQLLARYQALLA
ncbi:MAG: hypothetical protein KZQ58_07070 [gamma proteobacterium symbiont of Bathyaustriella thionipta]|nr:hypothetical protein [gamma proteobacterium symbiont of Bathyaustriella thionipta]